MYVYLLGWTDAFSQRVYLIVKHNVDSSVANGFYLAFGGTCKVKYEAHDMSIKVANVEH